MFDGSALDPSLLTLGRLYGTHVQYRGIEISIARGQKLVGSFGPVDRAEEFTTEARRARRRKESEH